MCLYPPYSSFLILVLVLFCFQPTGIIFILRLLHGRAQSIPSSNWVSALNHPSTLLSQKKRNVHSKLSVFVTHQHKCLSLLRVNTHAKYSFTGHFGVAFQTHIFKSVFESLYFRGHGIRVGISFLSGHRFRWVGSRIRQLGNRLEIRFLFTVDEL